jgi:S1-C subfamily serine protease
VRPGSPAAQEGLRPGDIISRINGTPVRDVDDAARAAKAAAKGGDHATLLVRRGDVQQFVSVALS